MGTQQRFSDSAFRAGATHRELLTPYLQAASVVSLSWFFTCGVEVFSRSPRACSADMPAFCAAARMLSCFVMSSFWEE